MKWRTLKPLSQHLRLRKGSKETSSSQSIVRQISAPETVVIKPNLDELSHTTTSGQHGSGGAPIEEKATNKPKPAQPFRSLHGKSNLSQIPSDPAADESAYQFLLASGFNISSKNVNKEKALLWAINKKQGNAVRLLLNRGANIEIIDDSQESVLHKAASAGDENVLRVLLYRQINIDAKNLAGWTALHVAAANGRGSLVRLLLKAGADPYTTTPHQKNALHLAVESKNASSIEILLKDPNLDARNADGWTALQVAAAGGSANTVRALLEAGADCKATTPHGMNALDLAIESKAEQSIKVLLERVAGVELCIYGGGELIQQTMAKYGADTIVRLLIVQQAQERAELSTGATVLHVAAEKGYLAVVRLLLENDCNVGALDHLGRTALHLAARYGHRQVVELLLLRQADVSIKCKSYSTALHLSAEKGYLEITRILLAVFQSHHYDINIRDKAGQTPMFMAIVNGHTPIVKLFIERRADHMIRNHDARSAASFADERRHKQVLYLLRDYEGSLAREKGSHSHLPQKETNDHWSTYEKQNNMLDPTLLLWP